MWYILVVYTIDKSESDKDLSVVTSTGRRAESAGCIYYYKTLQIRTFPGNTQVDDLIQSSSSGVLSMQTPEMQKRLGFSLLIKIPPPNHSSIRDRASQGPVVV